MPSIVPLGTLIWHVHVFEGELAVLRAQADVLNKNKLKLTLRRQERLFLQLSIKNKRDCNIKFWPFHCTIYTVKTTSHKLTK